MIEPDKILEIVAEIDNNAMSMGYYVDNTEYRNKRAEAWKKLVDYLEEGNNG